MSGKITYSVLYQDEVWINVKGEVLELASLDESYLRNIIGFLLRHGEKMRWHWLLREGQIHFAAAREVVGEIDGKPMYSGRMVPLFSDNGGNLDHAYEQWTDHQMDRPLVEWLDDQPLAKKIRALIAERVLARDQEASVWADYFAAGPLYNPADTDYAEFWHLETDE